ncbi:unnamed protein product [Larinioides sclopetarius]|uniref:Uncharacterized protein n=1 Tax=Larinioides sclopetarius TaxID=280406 RepID=A0AAV2B6V4_9ARAC
MVRRIWDGVLILCQIGYAVLLLGRQACIYRLVSVVCCIAVCFLPADGGCFVWLHCVARFFSSRILWWCSSSRICLICISSCCFILTPIKSSKGVKFVLRVMVLFKIRCNRGTYLNHLSG